VAVAGDGVWITDAQGRRYLDAVGSVHVVSVGHGVPEIATAVAEQLGQLSFASTRHFANWPQLELAELIGSMAPPGLSHCFFASGGSEAVELSIQIAHHWQTLRGRPGKTKVIGQRRSFHGGTLAAVSVGGHPGHRKRLAPYLMPSYLAPPTPAEGADPVEFGRALEELILREDPDTVGAFIAEPITGTTSGAVVPPPGWYETVRAVCDAHDMLFIVDEVTTGFGRTGRNFAIQHWSVVPDVLLGSKGLNSGYAPLAAIVVHERLAADLQSGPARLPVRLTFAGNPLACAAGLAVQRYVQQHGLVERCEQMGDYLHSLVAELAESSPYVGTPRGRGLLVGVPLWRDADERVPFARSERVQERVVAAALDHGLVIMGGTGSDDSPDGDHLLLSPPFVISEAECERVVELLAETLADVLGPELASAPGTALAG
jgi:adenosylmethionine-8-amino-7-oxononanoate aminotransferase